jgi:hypothetical protein
MSEVLLKVAPFVAMALQLVVGRFGASRIRGRIKANAELLEKLPVDGDARATLAKHIDFLTVRLVEVESRTFRRKRDAEGVALGLVMLVGFGYWSYVLIQADELWWALLTAFFATSGLLGLVDELRGKDEEAESTTGASAPEELAQIGNSSPRRFSSGV